MPKIRLKNRKEHRPNMKLTLERMTSYGTVRRKSLFEGWHEVSREKLRVKFEFLGQEVCVESDLSYNKYGQVNGWHPICGSEELWPYMTRILDAMYKMNAGDRKTIMVEGR